MLCVTDTCSEMAKVQAKPKFEYAARYLLWGGLTDLTDDYQTQTWTDFWVHWDEMLCWDTFLEWLHELSSPIIFLHQVMKPGTIETSRFTIHNTYCLSRSTKDWEVSSIQVWGSMLPWLQFCSLKQATFRSTQQICTHPLQCIPWHQAQTSKIHWILSH